jgi:hypothetical protein
MSSIYKTENTPAFEVPRRKYTDSAAPAKPHLALISVP